MSASGLLFEVFNITGRGTVAVLDKFDGQARAGDFLLLGSAKYKITGTEIVSFRDVEAAERNARLGRVGLLVAGCTKEQLETYKGQRLQIEPASA